VHLTAEPWEAGSHACGSQASPPCLTPQPGRSTPRAASEHHGVHMPACILQDAAAFTQKHPRAKTCKGKGSESDILLSNTWVLFYSISHKIFLMCIDNAVYCAVVEIRAQWHSETGKWPPRL